MGRPYIVKALQASSAAAADLQWFFQVAGASMSATRSLSEGGGGAYREGEPARVIAIADRVHADRPRYTRIARTIERISDGEVESRLESAFRMRGDPPELRSYFGQIAGLAEGIAAERHEEAAKNPRRWLIRQIKNDSGVASKIRDEADGLLASALLAYEIASGLVDTTKPKQPKKKRRSALDRVCRAVIAMTGRRS